MHLQEKLNRDRERETDSLLLLNLLANPKGVSKVYLFSLYSSSLTYMWLTHSYKVTFLIQNLG